MTFWKPISLGVLAVAASLGIASIAQQIVPQTTIAQPAPSPSPTANPIPEKPNVPYVPSPEVVVTAMLKLAGVTNGDVVYDLGSGDGRLVIAAVQQFGAQRGVGVEINPGLVRVSNENAQKAGVSDRAQFVQQDLFKMNFSDASVITLYLLPDINLKLRPILLNTLKPGTRIVSHSFSMGDWQPDKKLLVQETSPPRLLYYWVIPANVAGTWQGNLGTSASTGQPYILQFTQQFQQVKGSVIVNGQQIDIPQVALTGDRLSFSRTETIGGQSLTVQFNGQVQGDTLKGTAELKGRTGSRSYPIVAKRSERPQAAKSGQ